MPVSSFLTAQRIRLFSAVTKTWKIFNSKEEQLQREDIITDIQLS